MADLRINRKDLWIRLANLNQKDWIRAGQNLGLSVYPGGRGSHYVFHNQKFPEKSDTRGHIATIQKNIYKEASENIFKHCLACGIKEDDIWKALRMLS